jgi:hypothetical protein
MVAEKVEEETGIRESQLSFRGRRKIACLPLKLTDKLKVVVKKFVAECDQIYQERGVDGNFATGGAS